MERQTFSMEQMVPHCSVEVDQDTAIIVLPGDASFEDKPELNDYLIHNLAEPGIKKIAVDLAAMDVSPDSGLLTYLIEAAKMAKGLQFIDPQDGSRPYRLTPEQQKQFVLRNAAPATKWLLEYINLDYLLEDNPASEES